MKLKFKSQKFQTDATKAMKYTSAVSPYGAALHVGRYFIFSIASD